MKHGNEKKNPYQELNPGHLSHSPSLYSIQITYPGPQIKVVTVYLRYYYRMHFGILKHKTKHHNQVDTEGQGLKISD
jgi:hypothetical protein